MDINIDNICGHGGNYKDFNVGWQQRPYEIHWYKIDNKNDESKGNILILTSISASIMLNVERIMQN